MKVWGAPAYIFNYAFNNVCAVFYDRYPNSFAKHIISEDVIWREVSKDKILTRKLIVKKGASFLNSAPKWLTRYVSIQFMPTLEESIYDKKSSVLTTRTRNISWNNVFKMDEHCTYKPLDLNKTELSRQLYVSINYGHISALAERFIVMAFKKSVRKTAEGFLEKLQERFSVSAVDNNAKINSMNNTNNNSVRLISDKIIKQKFELENI